MNTDLKRFFALVLLLACLVHAVFCWQAYSALPGGDASNSIWLGVFFPHYVLGFILPRDWPYECSGSSCHVNYIEFWSKMLVAFPASIVYGSMLVVLLGGAKFSHLPPIA